MQRDEFLDTLPEAANARRIILDLLDDLRHATDIDDVNIAAGIAHQRLERQT